VLSYQVVVLHRPLKMYDRELKKDVPDEVSFPKFAASLESAGFRVHLLCAGDDIASQLDAYDCTKTIFFNCCEGTEENPNGYDPITCLLEEGNYVYTGATDATLKWSFDKSITKVRLVHHQIPTPRYAIYQDGDSRAWDIFPSLVKPVNQHGSFGITRASVVDSSAELEEQVTRVYQTWGKAALVEDFIDGPEYRVYILGNEILEILPLYGTWYDASPDYHDHIWGFENKWGEQSDQSLRHELPAILDPALETAIKEAAATSYRICEARDYGTVDIRVRDGRPYVLDVNQNPDISEGFSFAQAAEAGGCSYPELLARIVLLATERLPR
jgi:D-alanine-D-alanine ligase